MAYLSFYFSLVSNPGLNHTHPVLMTSKIAKMCSICTCFTCRYDSRFLISTTQPTILFLCILPTSFFYKNIYNFSGASRPDLSFKSLIHFCEMFYRLCHEIEAAIRACLSRASLYMFSTHVQKDVH